MFKVSRATFQISSFSTLETGKRKKTIIFVEEMNKKEIGTNSL